MKKSLRTLIALLCLGGLLATVALAAGTYTKTLAAFYRDIRLSINGQTVVPKDVNGTVVDPFIVDGTTYLPVRAVSEALGKQVDWDDETSTVLISDPSPDLIGTWNAVKVSLRGDDTPLDSFAGGSFTVRLDDSLVPYSEWKEINTSGQSTMARKGVWVIGGEDFDITWSEENGALTILDESGSGTYGTVLNGVMVLNIEGTFVTLTK